MCINVRVESWFWSKSWNFLAFSEMDLDMTVYDVLERKKGALDYKKVILT